MTFDESDKKYAKNLTTVVFVLQFIGAASILIFIFLFFNSGFDQMDKAHERLFQDETKFNDAKDKKNEFKANFDKIFNERKKAHQ